MNLLAIPLKTTVRSDLHCQISDIVSQDFHQSPSAFSADLDSLDKCRYRIETTQTPVSVADCTRLAEYFDFINALATKLDDTSIQVSWNGESRQSIKYEQANVLIQLGLAYMDLGYHTPKSNKEDYIRGVTHYQFAAGCFLCALKEFKSHADAQELSFLLNLLLAQAQEIVWLKAVRGELRDSAIARLLQGVSQLYWDALKFSNEQYSNHVRLKHLHFAGAAMFRQSKVMQESREYGQQVASLKNAEKLCEMAFCLTVGVEISVLEDLKGLANAVKEQARVAIKSNDLVHMQPVPSEPKPISPHILCLATIPPQIYQETKMLGDLVPCIVESIARAFKKRAQDFINSRINQPIQELDHQLVAVLDQRQLPSSLDALQYPENVPASMLKYAKEVSDAGGFAFVEQSLQRLAQIRQACHALRTRCISSFCDEPPTGPLATKLDYMRSYLAQAEEGDNTIAAKFAVLEPRLRIFETSDLLKRYIPNANYTLPSQEVQDICEKLRTIISAGDIMKSQRRDTLINIMGHMNQNPIESAVFNAYKKSPVHFCDESGKVDPGKFEDIYHRYVDKFAEETRFIEKSRAAQKEWERDLDGAYVAFQDKVSYTDESQTKRHEALHLLESTYLEYKQLRMSLNEGFEFYNTFQDRGRAVLDECEQHTSSP